MQAFNHRHAVKLPVGHADALQGSKLAAAVCDTSRQNTVCSPLYFVNIYKRIIFTVDRANDIRVLPEPVLCFFLIRSIVLIIVRTASGKEEVHSHPPGIITEPVFPDLFICLDRSVQLEIFFVFMLIRDRSHDTQCMFPFFVLQSPEHLTQTHIFFVSIFRQPPVRADDRQRTALNLISILFVIIAVRIVHISAGADQLVIADGCICTE